jgi:hypothetical protein
VDTHKYSIVAIIHLEFAPLIRIIHITYHDSESGPLARIMFSTSTTLVGYTTVLFPPSSSELGAAAHNFRERKNHIMYNL